MENDVEDVEWLTQQVTQLPSSQDNCWRHPETVPMVRYVYDDEEYVEDVPNQVVIRQRLPDVIYIYHDHPLRLPWPSIATATATANHIIP